MTAEVKGKVSLDGSSFTSGLRGIQRETEAWASGNLKMLKGAIAGAFSITVLIQFINKCLEIGDAIADTSKRLGLGVETTQSLQVAAERAGVEFGAFEQAIYKLRAAQTDAAAGNESAAKSFGALGISMVDVMSLPAEQLFERVASAMAQNKGSAEALAGAMDVLGSKGSVKLQASLIELGEKGFGKLNEEMLQSGQILGTDVVNALDQNHDRIAKVTTAVKNFTVTLVGGLLAGYERYYNTVSGVSEALADEAAAQALATEEAKKAAEQKLRQIELEKEHKKFLEALAEYQKTKEKFEAAHLTMKQQEVRLTAEIAALEEKLNAYYNTQNLSAAEATKLETELLKKREALAAIEEKLAGEIARDRQQALENERKQLEEIARARASWEEALARQLFEQLSIDDKILEIKTRIAEASEHAHALEEQGNTNLKEYHEWMGKLVGLGAQLRDLEQEKAEAAKKSTELAEKAYEPWSKLSAEQAKTIVDLQEALEGLSDEDITDFLDTLGTLATGLSKLPKAPDLGWMRDLSSFKLPTIHGPETTGFVIALRGLLLGIAGLDFTKLKELGEAMSHLGDLASFKFPKVKTFNAGDFIVVLDQLLNSLKGKDLSKLKELGDLFKNMGGLAPGEYKIKIEVPDSVKLAVPSTFSSNLSTIAGYLQTLAGMKGVIWK